MHKLLQSLRWLDDHLMKIGVMGYIVLIPLYPKLPLMMVDYTYIAIRAEDVYVAVFAFLALIWFVRGKLRVNWKYAGLFGAFWIAVFASAAWGHYIMDTVPVRNLGILHSFRRIEYMCVFFIAASTIRSRKDLEQYVGILLITFGIAALYGIGQKFLGWPAVQTMNPEYAKGYLLVLDANARISSTFAGHYDFAAYLVFFMPLVLCYYLYSGKYIWFGVFLASLVALILTASRASYIAYLFVIIPLLLSIKKYKLLLVVLICTALLTPLSDNLTKRLTRTFQQTKVFVDPTTGKTMVTRDIRPDELPPGDFGANLPPILPSTNTVVDKKTATTAKKQIRETIIKDAKKSGKILTEKEINALVEQTFGRQIAVTKYLIDISLSTRFQVEWPRAIAAFIRNPFLGTGPSSLTEATDGDYFRWLGETGLIGTSLFIIIIISILKDMMRTRTHLSQKEKYIVYGFFAGTIALLVNATYIDVFEASKVAYMFWVTAGIMIGVVQFQHASSPRHSSQK